MAQELGIKQVYLSGHLHSLWHNVLEQQEDGNLINWPDELIAQMAAFDGDAKQFVFLLRKHKWLDGSLVHDWMDYAGKYLWRKYHTANPRKLKAIQKVHKVTIRSPKPILNDTQKVATRGLSPVLSSYEFKKGESEGEKPGLTVEKLVELYNSETPDECPAINTISPARRDKAKKYLKIFPTEQFWHDCFTEIHNSPFLKGLRNTNSHKGFIASFDWLLTKGKDQTENCVKVAEGRYRNG